MTGLRQYGYIGALAALTLALDDVEFLGAGALQFGEVDSVYLRGEVADLRRLTTQLAAQRGTDDGVAKPAAQVASAR